MLLYLLQLENISDEKKKLMEVTEKSLYKLELNKQLLEIKFMIFRMRFRIMLKQMDFQLLEIFVDMVLENFYMKIRQFQILVKKELDQN